MSSDNSNNWIADTVGDFIHSPIWTAPIHTFIEARCAAFDYDDENNGEENSATSPTISLEEQMNIHEDYTRLVDALIYSLGQDLGLNEDDLNKVCQIPIDSENSVMVDESYEQLYAARDFSLFQEMMRRKNLILQLQALVSLQLQWGLLKQSDTGDDLVLSLLMQATASPSSTATTTTQRPPVSQVERPVVKQEVSQKKIQIDHDDDDDVVAQTPSSSVSKITQQRKEKKEPKKPVKQEIHLPDLRKRGGDNLDADWYRNLRQNVSQKNNKNNDDDDDPEENDQSQKSFTPQSIGAVPQNVLREKLRQLTDETSLVDEKTAAAIRERKDFLQKQRAAIVEKQKNERTEDLEQEQQTTRQARPQSAALARKAMTTNQNTQQQQQPQISNEELNRRRAMAEKLRREVVDKR